MDLFGRKARAQRDAACMAGAAIGLGYASLQDEYNQLEEQLEEVAEFIENMGGIENIRTAVANTAMYDKRQLNQMIALVHPDKHNGKAASHNLTVLLNSLKDQLDTNKKK